MKTLFIKLSIFSIICLFIITTVLLKYGGNVDYFYQKFTTPKAKSMIIGDSRSFQGIQPSIINNYFKGKDFGLPMLNYSFTIGQAIIGPLYNKSIFKKLDESSINGIFIISITPEMLSEHSGFNNANGEFREQGQPPHNMEYVDMNPNYEYFIKNLSFFHFQAMFRRNSETHKDGWLEEKVLPKDEGVFNEWRNHQINLFLKDAKNSKFSNTRIQSLKDLISKLKVKGNVYLLRMPISDEFYSYEDMYYPGFDKIIDSISKFNNIDYFNFKLIDRSYKTYDGHHIDKYEGKNFTKDLCDLINVSIKKRD
jgi:hypothetical protein